jgi:hypothetical protein
MRADDLAFERDLDLVLDDRNLNLLTDIRAAGRDSWRPRS